MASHQRTNLIFKKKLKIDISYFFVGSLSHISESIAIYDIYNILYIYNYSVFIENIECSLILAII